MVASSRGATIEERSLKRGEPGRGSVLSPGGSEKEEETKLGIHSCRSDLPADNCVAFPQMASGDERRGRIVNRRRKKKMRDA